MKRTEQLDREKYMATIVRERQMVALSGINNGTGERSPYLSRCIKHDFVTGTVLIFSRDCGHHTSGWWKNPDYEYCWHLSLSFFDPQTRSRLRKDIKLTDQWIDIFYGNNKKLLWCEPPYIVSGKANDVWHYRLFTDSRFHRPIKPRGEVYTKEFTEAGWKSYTHVQAEEEAARQNIEILGI